MEKYIEKTNHLEQYREQQQNNNKTTTNIIYNFFIINIKN
jgi:hypothetical protein